MYDARVERRARTAAAAIGLAAICASACGRGEMLDGRTAAGSAPAATAAAPPAGTSAMVHGDHNPKYGGVVLMNGDLHYEVVLPQTGQYHVYFSDAARNELPASMATDVTITVTRPGDAPEIVALQIDETGESWVGQGRPVANPETIARISYAFRGKPYWIDVPFSAAKPAAAPAGTPLAASRSQNLPIAPDPKSSTRSAAH
jgi:hypothetical protein